VSAASPSLSTGAQPFERIDTGSRSPRVSLLLQAICVVVIAVMLFPLVMCFFASIKTAQDASATPPHYFPGAVSLENYLKVFHYQAGLSQYLGNSLAVAALTIALCLGLGAPAAYGLARFSVPAKELIFLFLLSGLMAPYQALLTPLYTMAAWLGLANTYLGLAIVHTVIQLPFSIFVLRNAFEDVPRELEEAALIDGCNSLQLLRRIFLPAIVPAIVTVTLFAFIASWNEFLAALIFMNKETAFTIPIMLVGVRQGHFGAIDWGALQAGVIVSILPCLAIYLLLQKYYVSGFLSGAIK
jgi:multiple sugar transport system permease protein